MEQQAKVVGGQDAPASGQHAANTPKGGSKRLRIAAVIGLVLVVALVWWLYARRYEDTDDAQVDGNISAVSPRVPGTVVAVKVVENQPVKAGDVLVELDATDLEVGLAQAKAAVAQAQAQVAAESPSVSMTETSNVAALQGADADVETVRSDMEAAQKELEQALANDRLAKLQLDRGKQLLGSGAIPQADYDQRVAQADVATSAVAAARQRYDGRKSRLEASQSKQRETHQNAPRQLVTREANLQARQANLAAAQAQLHQAQLNLGYAKITAPADGIVGKKSVNVGDRVQPGQQLFALTQTGELWVTANFRETQTELMRVGQPATVHVDGVDRDYRGEVESFAGATGSRYALLPPENASGNYVKVVQRIPVRIRLDPQQPDMERLRPGMSAEPKVKIRVTERNPDGTLTGGLNPWAIALTVTIATFMEVLDTSIANVSLPHMAGSLSVSQDESTWVLTSYLVSNAIVLPVSGWFATRFGRKRFYMTCVAVFTVSSFLCGIAPNLGTLIFFRVLQGLGGGGLQPSEQAILAETFPAKKRGMAFAVYGMAVVLAPAIGPTLGGYITDHFSWRWVFFINVPVGLISLVLSNRVVIEPPESFEKRKRVGGIDYVGLALVAVGLGSLEYVLDKGQEDDWFSSHAIIGFSITALVALVSFVIWEWHQEHPVVDVRLFKNRNFASANAMMLVLGLALFGSTVLLPQYLQIWMGYTAQEAGMALSPGGLVVIMLLPLVGKLVGKVDARWLIAFGFVALSVALFHMAHTLYPGIDFSTAMRMRIYQSIGLPFLFVPINTIVYAGLPPEKNNAVSGMVNLSRNMGADIGISMVTTLIARRSQVHQAQLATHLDPGNPALQSRLTGIARALEHAGSSSVQAVQQAYGVVYGQLIRQAQTLAYVDVLFVLGCVVAAMVPLVFVVRKVQPGKAVVGH